MVEGWGRLGGADGGRVASSGAILWPSIFGDQIVCLWLYIGKVQGLRKAQGRVGGERDRRTAEIRGSSANGVIIVSKNLIDLCCNMPIT